jgi:hypothetical protein
LGGGGAVEFGGQQPVPGDLGGQLVVPGPCPGGCLPNPAVPANLA